MNVEMLEIVRTIFVLATMDLGGKPVNSAVSSQYKVFFTELSLKRINHKMAHRENLSTNKTFKMLKVLLREQSNLKKEGI